LKVALVEGPSMELRNETKKKLIPYLFALFANIVFRTIRHHNLTLFCWSKQITILSFFLYYHINSQYKCFVDLLSSDFLEKKYRFRSIYNLLSVCYNNRLFVNILVDDTMVVDSIVYIYPNAMWYERESWDLYGILYDNNFDLRRILNDYGFKGFPLRKDFPLSGFLEVKYDYLEKSISYEPVRLVQGFRNFNTNVPWNFYTH